jgi:hypothetical protein
VRPLDDDQVRHFVHAWFDAAYRRLETGMWGLCRFQYLTAAQDAPAEITFRLPIREPGKYAVSLRYLPRSHHASNASSRVAHAAGEDVQTWNLQRGHMHGFDVKIGEYHFDPDRPATVTISNPNADGVVVADSVSYVKMPADDPIPAATSDARRVWINRLRRHHSAPLQCPNS